MGAQSRRHAWLVCRPCGRGRSCQDSADCSWILGDWCHAQPLPAFLLSLDGTPEAHFKSFNAFKKLTKRLRSSCSSTCGAGTQTRAVSCQSGFIEARFMRCRGALREDCPKPMPASSAACYSTQLCAWVGALVRQFWMAKKEGTGSGCSQKPCFSQRHVPYALYAADIFH